MTSVISIKNLTKTYGNGFHALLNLSLEIEEGEILALLGPNGAGKTTLISSVCGLLSVPKNTITIGGFDVSEDYRKSRSLIGLVPQEITIEPFETVMNAVSFSRGLFGKPKNSAYIEQLLTDLSLYDKRNQKYKTSDGFRSFYAVNLPVVSENNSLTNTYIFSFFEELYQDNVTKLSFYAKSSTSLTNDDIKLSERIFLPSHRLRGFVSGGVGPKDGNDFIGGNYASSLNIQTSIPQLLPNIQNMDVSMFLDAGNVWGVDYDSSLSDTNKIRSSIGIGVDWFTLVGPLSVSFSHPISKVDTDRTETFKFNLGTTF